MEPDVRMLLNKCSQLWSCDAHYVPTLRVLRVGLRTWSEPLPQVTVIQLRRFHLNTYNFCEARTRNAVQCFPNLQLLKHRMHYREITTLLVQLNS